MPSWLTSPDFFLVAAVTAIAALLSVGPYLDTRAKARQEQPGAKLATYREAMIMLWLMAAIGILGWSLSGRPLSEIGFAPVREGWQGLAALGLMTLALGYCAWQLIQMWVSASARISVRQQLEGVNLSLVRPTNRSEAWRFQALSATAGITEEIVFRGLLIAAFALVMPLWLAVILSLIAFTLPHAYQGPNGMARVLPTGAFLTAIVLLGGSLWPAIIAHWVIDMTTGFTFPILDRFEHQDGAEGVEARDTAALEA